VGSRKRSAKWVDALLAHRWGRLLVPSLADFLFVALIGWLFMSSGAHGWQSLLADADVGWHIRTGEYILDHYRVPHHDLYSFSKPGAPWYAWEWLTDVLDGLLYRCRIKRRRAGGGGADRALRHYADAADCRRGARICSWRCWSPCCRWARLPCTSWPGPTYLRCCCCRFRWDHEADRRGARPARIWWLVPIALVWTNLHGGFLVLIGLLGLAAIGAGVEAWLEKPWAALRTGIPRCAGGGCGGLRRRVFRQSLRMGTAPACPAIPTLGLDPQSGAGFQSPSFRDENMLQFEVLLFIGLITAGVRLRRGQVIDGLWILCLGYLSLSSVRHVPLFVTVACPMIAVEMTCWWKSWVGAGSQQSVPGILNQMGRDIAPGFQRFSIWMALAVVALASSGSAIAWPRDFPAQLFPTAMVHAHEQEILHARVLTIDQWGDYLIYLHPEQKVFVDGRSDFYGPEIGDQFLQVMRGMPGWEKVIAKYRFNLVLIRWIRRPRSC